MWGLDSNGEFVVNTEEEDDENEEDHEKNWMKSCHKKVLDALALLTTKKQEEIEKSSIPDRIKGDLQGVIRHTKKEMDRFHHMKLSDREKSKRILFHFQKDLMAGLSGQVLESQDRREEITQKPYSQTMKRCCWALLFAMNAGMLFYVFLFGVSRDGHHQAAWAKSFAMWLIMEILMVSSVMVLLMNVLLPILTMKDVKKIKMRLIDTIVQYNRKLHETIGGANGKGDRSLETTSTVFNAAQYLFVSYRLAREYPELRVSKIILAYETPWPRQSYLRTTQAVTQTYSRKFAAIYQAVTVLATYAITNFLTFPIHLQDMIVQISSTFVLGYTIIIHIQLYLIYPVLIVVPTIIIAAILHFFVKSSAAQHKIETMKLLHYEKDQKSSGHVVKTDNGEIVHVDYSDNGSLVSSALKTRRQSIQVGMNMLQRGRDQLQFPSQLSEEWSEEYDELLSESSLSFQISLADEEENSERDVDTNWSASGSADHYDQVLDIMRRQQALHDPIDEEGSDVEQYWDDLVGEGKSQSHAKSADYSEDYGNYE